MFTSPKFFLACFVMLFLRTSMVPESTPIIRMHRTDAGDQYLIFDGKIDQGSAERVHANLLREPQTKGLIITSPGGLLTESMRISQDVRHYDLAVIVPNMCASGCFLVLAASNDRLAARTAHIGVHSARVSDGGYTSVQDTETGNTNQADVMRLFKVPMYIIGRAVSTPASDVYWLNQNDLKTMDVTLVDIKALTKKRRRR